MNLAERLRRDGVTESQIALFYHPEDQRGGFSNFSTHSIVLPSPWTREPTLYRSSEHRYQALKSLNRSGHDLVVAALTPGVAKRRGREVDLREDWGNDVGHVCWYVMMEALVAKTIQHDEIRALVVATRELWLYEDSPTDDIWGWRYGLDHSGKNLLGGGWMHVGRLLGIRRWR